ncbi:MAG: AAA family ATPase [Acidimicrobiales bacterium]
MSAGLEAARAYGHLSGRVKEIVDEELGRRSDQPPREAWSILTDEEAGAIVADAVQTFMAEYDAAHPGPETDPETVAAFKGLDDPGLTEWIAPIDWTDFWATDASVEDWLLEPVVAVGRQTAVYSTAKTGKSLLALDIAAAAAMGRSVLGYPPKAPIDVIYVDLEMTQADLRERLTDLGYGPDDDLGRLHYFQLPPLPPLDADLGGKVLSAVAEARGAALVVIDTMARAVAGEENSADTYRGFYRHTGRHLKAAGIALLRLDHAGKDGALGQRGSSAKVDDVDIVFRLVQVDPRMLKLTRTHSRVPWVPLEVTIVREEEPRLRHRQAEDAVPAHTHEAVLALDELDVPLDATATTALAVLREAGRGQRKAVVLAALKARRKVAS